MFSSARSPDGVPNEVITLLFPGLVTLAPSMPDVPDEPLDPEVPEEPDEPEVPLEPEDPEVPDEPLDLRCLMSLKYHLSLMNR